MRGDGDGFVFASGTRYWGRHGAAGLLLRARLPDGTAAVLLQHRAPWSHQGGTWALPGGARDSHESPEDAAVREAHEEAGLSREQLTVRASVVTVEVGSADGGDYWSYTTVIADAAEPARDGAEPGEFRTALGAGGRSRTLRLHPGFADSWQRLRDKSAAIPLSP